jgi:xylulokinase
MLPQARGMMYGLSMQTTQADIYRAILEGLSFEMAINLEALKGFGIVPDRLFACGGGAKSQVWLKIKADVWNREVIPVLTEETGALGSAILGFAAVSGEKDLMRLAQGFVRHGEPIRPDPENAACYQQQLVRYRRIRRLMTEELSAKERTY